MTEKMTKKMTEFEQTKLLAEQGDADAQNNLGDMYYFGRGVKENDAEALRWFTKAAEQGHAEAQYNVGHMYEKGKGVDQNDAEAARWHKKAAEQGHTGSQHLLVNLLVKLTPPTQPKRDFKRDFTSESRFDTINHLQNEINGVVLAYAGAITLAEAIGVLEIAKIELYNNQ